MARYQILYWRHIPLGVKASDLDGTTRKNLPQHFQMAFEEASANIKRTHVDAYTTSGFSWSEEMEREGTGAEVAAIVVKELTEAWNEAEALVLFEKQKNEMPDRFLDLKEL